MTRILIIDDEAAAGNILKVLIEKHIHLEKEIRISHNPVEGLKIIKEWKPALLMLDIEMPELNGFSLLTQLDQIDFHVIFTTAYDKYAIKAIRFSALDYLLKPIDQGELIQAFQRFEKLNHSETDPTEEKLDNLLVSLKNKTLTKIALNTSKGVYFPSIEDIIYCEGVSNYTRFYFTRAESIIISRTLKEFEELLQDHGFFRIHKSYLANIKRIVRLEGEYVVLDIEKKLPVARRRKEELIGRLLR